MKILCKMDIQAIQSH